MLSCVKLHAHDSERGKGRLQQKEGFPQQVAIAMRLTGKLRSRMLRQTGQQACLLIELVKLLLCPTAALAMRCGTAAPPARTPTCGRAGTAARASCGQPRWPGRRWLRQRQKAVNCWGRRDLLSQLQIGSGQVAVSQTSPDALIFILSPIVASSALSRMLVLGSGAPPECSGRVVFVVLQ